MFKVAYNGEVEKVLMKDCIKNTLDALLESDEKVAYLDADLMASVGTYPLTKKYPDRVIDCGIQEANMIGVACGMSTEGYKPYCHTFGVFAGRRVHDQVFMSGAYAYNHLNIIGSDPGIQALYNGGTHQPYEDTSMYRTMPNTSVFDAADTTQLKWILENIKDRDGVNYVRSARKNVIKVYEEGSTFEMGKGVTLREGGDVALVACGMMVAEALEAAELLKAEGIEATVIDVVSIKPLDAELINETAKKTGCMVTCENAFVKGGLFGAVTECVALAKPVPVEYVGVYERFGEVGDLPYLKKAMKLNAEEIVAKAKAAMARK